MIEKQADVVVIGGGIIGISLAYGLSKQNAKVLLIDKEDPLLTASRGNFGLVWVQSKGEGMPEYVEWCIEAADKWPQFSENLETETGIQLEYAKNGGVEIWLGDEEYNTRVNFIDRMRKASRSGTYDCEMLKTEELQEILPEIKLGEEVSGGSFCPHDGYVNPLNLVKAMHKGFKLSGGNYYSGQSVTNIEFLEPGFRIHTENNSYIAEKLVIAGGLVSKKLGKMVDIDVPVGPERGQVLVTERTKKILPFPAGRIRQNFDGSFMFGNSNEDVGYNIETTSEVMKKIAHRAIRTFPFLKNLQLIRSWSALRVLTPDRNPVYVESKTCPGAFAVTSHSGVSLASVHSSNLGEWIIEGSHQAKFEVFHPRRFDVPKTA
jgi:glycine/D-amino acid oxidase-like deaminating enzyme